jgi:hypothetical protein
MNTSRRKEAGRPLARPRPTLLSMATSVRSSSAGGIVTSSSGGYTSSWKWRKPSATSTRCSLPTQGGCSSCCCHTYTSRTWPVRSRCWMRRLVLAGLPPPFLRHRAAGPVCSRAQAVHPRAAAPGPPERPGSRPRHVVGDARQSGACPNAVAAGSAPRRRARRLHLLWRFRPGAGRPSRRAELHDTLEAREPASSRISTGTRPREPALCRRPGRGEQRRCCGRNRHGAGAR